ncbi:unnamed protein product [Colias eurytheme]|nr:unnamed protein product [Colias eurytheme]
MPDLVETLRRVCKVSCRRPSNRQKARRLTEPAHWCTSRRENARVDETYSRDANISEANVCPPLHSMTVTQMERRRTQFRERATAWLTHAPLHTVLSRSPIRCRQSF